MSQTNDTLTATYPRTADLSETERDRLFGSKHCRLVLAILANATTAISLTDLAKEIAAEEDRSDPEDEDSVTQLEVELHHTVLPKMDKMGVLDYNVHSNYVRR